MMKQVVLAKLGLRPRLTSPHLFWPLVGVVASSTAVGAALALLFAPKSGKEARQDIAGAARAGTRKLALAASRVETTTLAARDRLIRRNGDATPSRDVVEVVEVVESRPKPRSRSSKATTRSESATRSRAKSRSRAKTRSKSKTA